MNLDGASRKHVLLAAYDDWFLRPLDIGLIVVALVYLYHRAWLLGLFLLLFGGNLGLVGQALNKEKSFGELAHKRHWLRMAEFIAWAREKLEPDDSIILGKAVIGTSALLALSSGLIAIHQGMRSYFAIPLGIAFGFLIPSSFVVGLVLLGRILSSRA